MLHSNLPFLSFFIQLQESLFKGSGELELFIYTGKDNDNKTYINALDLTDGFSFNYT